MQPGGPIHVQVGNLVWKRNRNMYGLLMVLQLRAGRLEAPFDRSPMPGPLPALPRWQLKAYASARSDLLADTLQDVCCITQPNPSYASQYMLVPCMDK